jgi:hypothetical protein
MTNAGRSLPGAIRLRCGDAFQSVLQLRRTVRTKQVGILEHGLRRVDGWRNTVDAVPAKLRSNLQATLSGLIEARNNGNWFCWNRNGRTGTGDTMTDGFGSTSD